MLRLFASKLIATRPIATRRSVGSVVDFAALAEKKESVAIFLQDVADADNFAAVAAYIVRYGMPTKKKPIHFVLVQRPEHFGYPKFFPGCGFSFPGVVPSQPEEVCEKDSRLLAEHGAARLKAFLGLLDVPLEYVYVYNGECPEQTSNLSHLLHARDFLFVNPVNGDLATPENYARLQSELNGEVFVDSEKKYSYAKEPESLKVARQQRCRDFISQQLNELAEITGTRMFLQPLGDLYDWLAKEDNRPIVAIPLAPLTGLANLFAMDERGILRDRLVRVYGQLFAWDNCAPYFWTRSPQAVNILKNQFNVDCDTDVVEYVLEQLGLCKKLEHVVLVPTEAIKTPEMQAFYDQLDGELRDTPFDKLPPIARLWRQWNAVKGNKAQPIFDPVVIFLMHQMEIDQSDSTCANKLFEMTSAHVMIPADQSVYNWNRPVFCLAPGDSVGMNMRAALEVKTEMFDDFKAMMIELLQLLPSPSGVPASEAPVSE